MVIKLLGGKIIMKVKCPVCGNTRIAKTGHLTVGEYTATDIEVRVCLDCGHIMLFSENLAQEMKNVEEEEALLRMELEQINEEINKLKASSLDRGYYEQKLNRINGEIEALRYEKEHSGDLISFDLYSWEKQMEAKRQARLRVMDILKTGISPDHAVMLEELKRQKHMVLDRIGELHGRYYDD